MLLKNLPPLYGISSFLLIFISAQAYATSFYIVPFSTLVQNTPNMVLGTLQNIHPEHGTTNTGEKTIFTFADLTVEEVLKGQISGTQILVRKLGGSKDGVTLDIPSSVQFKENEQAVLFLGPPNPDNSYEVTEMELGKFGLKEVGGEKILTGGIFNFNTVDLPFGMQSDDQERLKENHKSWSIGELKKLIQNQAKAQDTNPKSSPPLSPVQALQGTVQAHQSPDSGSGSAPLPPPSDGPSPSHFTGVDGLKWALILVSGLSIILWYTKRR